MDYSNDKEQKSPKNPQEIAAKEAEIRLRELELEIYREQNQQQQEIPQYKTKKYQSTPSSLKRMAKKLVKVGKFLGFTVLTITLMKVGFTLGMWLAYGLVTVAVIFIGYQIFLNESDD